jgi:Tol biopolymer transport system component
LGTITGAIAGTTAATTLTIGANDPIAYAISAGAATVNEGNSGTTRVRFTVTRSGGINAASSINYAIGGTATNGSDYNNIGGTSGATGTTGTINFAQGQTAKTITMNVLGDSLVEPNETISVTLSNPVAPGPTPTITPQAATTTIVNDDVTPAFRRVSVASDGTQGNGVSFDSSISADGRYVAFASSASNLVSGDTNGAQDIFVKDLQTGTTKLISVANDGTQGNRNSKAPSISADGRYVAFKSYASNLVSGDTNGAQDIFVNDLQTGTTKCISVASDGTQGNSYSDALSISADGRYVAFESHASNLVSGDTNRFFDIFVNDLQTGTTKLISVASDGTQGNSSSSHPSISADGRYVAFESSSSNLVSGGTNGAQGIFVNDLQTGTTKLISVASDGTQGSSLSYHPSISADGRYVAFHSYARNLVSGATNSTADIFVKDLQTGTIKQISVASDGTQGNYDSYRPSISADGRYVAFYSRASNLVSGDTNGAQDIFVNDLQTGITKLISVASNETPERPISADGRYVTFPSNASNLVSGDTNDTADIFIYDRGYGTENFWTGTSENDSYSYTGTDNFSASGLAGSDTLIGGIGNDSLSGGDGNDILVGGFGIDTLMGGSGSDKFTFNSPTDGIDTISDFNAGEGDQILVSASGFGGGLAVGNLPSSQFIIGSSAANAGDRFIYNSSTGALFFDPDGNALQGQVQLAVLSSNPPLTSNDIFVVA